MTTEYSEEELLAQWEPKVHSMLRSVSIIGLDPEDIAQELRIAILKSARGYNPENTVAKFHTYLHVSMLNVIRSLIAKAQKRVSTVSLDQHMDGYTGERAHTRSNSQSVSAKLLAALEDTSQAFAFEEVDVLSIIENSNLTPQELDFLELRTQKFKLREITDRLGANSVRLRESIKKKLEVGLEHG
jgi:RNA polymerase sigma factor (sigma-70 family)|tara:strand:- start:40 stop:597 length:558 start_codon:yes stop_codon:yes gene_type:complete